MSALSPCERLVRALRECEPEIYCGTAPHCEEFILGRVGFCRDCLMDAAAAMIEELMEEIKHERDRTS